MKGITVRQPWAKCIASGVPGAKRVENRGRSTSYRGPLAIHAGKTADVAADTDPRVVRLWGTDPRLGAPVGAVIAVADLVDCHSAPLTGPACCQPWGERWHRVVGHRAWHLVLDNVRLLARPVHCPGRRSVPWTLPEVVAAAVTYELAVANDGQARS